MRGTRATGGDACPSKRRAACVLARGFRDRLPRAADRGVWPFTIPAYLLIWISHHAERETVRVDIGRRFIVNSVGMYRSPAALTRALRFWPSASPRRRVSEGHPWRSVPPSAQSAFGCDQIVTTKYPLRPARLASYSARSACAISSVEVSASARTVERRWLCLSESTTATPMLAVTNSLRSF